MKQYILSTVCLMTLSPVLQGVNRGETFPVIQPKPLHQNCHQLHAVFLDKSIPFIPYQSDQCIALIGVPFETKPGQYEVRLTESTQTVEVTNGEYRQETIQVNKVYLDAPEEVKQRIEDEYLMVQDLYNNWTMADETLRTMQLPVNNIVTSPFGTERLFNGERQSYHTGIDLRAGEGAAIRAPADGVVIFTHPLYFAGNHVVIDQGAGVVTTYSHLSQIKVKPGQTVKAGDVIGLSGSTGRVNGPHLHWGAKVHTTTVNPQQLQALLSSLVVTQGDDHEKYMRTRRE